MQDSVLLTEVFEDRTELRHAPRRAVLDPFIQCREDAGDGVQRVLGYLMGVVTVPQDQHCLR
jgi:hypothetical protein